MGKQKVFCENCRKKVPYRVKIATMENTVQGKTIAYEGLVSLCEYCENEVFVFEVENFNFQMYYLVRDGTL